MSSLQHSPAWTSTSSSPFSSTPSSSNASSVSLVSPPSYDLTVTGLDIASSRLKVQPRENEGNEALPPYSCSVTLSGMFGRKQELVGAAHKAEDRSWHKVFIQLRGTALSIYRPKRLSYGRATGSPDAPANIGAGELLRTYNLQNAEVGMAADCSKRHYAIRIRAEMDQFLLACHQSDTVLLWVDSLAAAISLAPPLDQRTVPIEAAIQRVIRLRAVPESAAGGENEQGSSPPTQDSQAAWPSSRSLREILTSSSSSSSSSRNHSVERSESRQSSPGGAWSEKWAPAQTWTPRFDLIYAKNSMAILLASDPHKSKYAISHGKMWEVDWATGRLEQC